MYIYKSIIYYIYNHVVGMRVFNTFIEEVRAIIIILELSLNLYLSFSP